MNKLSEKRFERFLVNSSKERQRLGREECGVSLRSFARDHMLKQSRGNSKKKLDFANTITV